MAPPMGFAAEAAHYLLPPLPTLLPTLLLLKHVRKRTRLAISAASAAKERAEELLGIHIMCSTESCEMIEHPDAPGYAQITALPLSGPCPGGTQRKRNQARQR